MQEILPANLIPGRQYQIRGRPGLFTENFSYWGNFVRHHNGLGTPYYQAIFTNLEPMDNSPVPHNPMAWGVPGRAYMFYGENPDAGNRRRAAITAHMQAYKNGTGRNADPSAYASLGTNRRPASRKNRRRKNKQSRNRR